MLIKKEEEKKEREKELTLEAVKILIRDLQNGTFAKRLKKANVSACVYIFVNLSEFFVSIITQRGPCRFIVIFTRLVLNSTLMFIRLIHPQRYHLGGEWKPGKIKKTTDEDDDDDKAVDDGEEEEEEQEESVAEESVAEESVAEESTAPNQIDDDHLITVARIDSSSSHGSRSKTWKTVE